MQSTFIFVSNRTLNAINFVFLKVFSIKFYLNSKFKPSISERNRLSSSFEIKEGRKSIIERERESWPFFLHRSQDRRRIKDLAAFLP